MSHIYLNIFSCQEDHALDNHSIAYTTLLGMVGARLVNVKNIHTYSSNHSIVCTTLLSMVGARLVNVKNIHTHSKVTIMNLVCAGFSLFFLFFFLVFSLTFSLFSFSLIFCYFFNFLVSR